MSGPVGGTGEKQNRTNAMCQAASCDLVAGDNKSQIKHRFEMIFTVRRSRPTGKAGGRETSVRRARGHGLPGHTRPDRPWPAGGRGSRRSHQEPGLPAVDLVIGHQAEDTHALVRP